jgi:hydroxymethylpyrimidine pyrophosphatase-like HAD family hydrolase
MRYWALATDYDGTLASQGVVNQAAIAALQRLRSSGRRLLLVTGRRLPELLDTFDRIDLFDTAVLENGAVLYQPETKVERLLAGAPHPAFIELLRKRDVQPLGVGHVIVATTVAHKETVLATIAELGLELQIIFNKGAVMVLPAGVNKATGLAAALNELGLSAHNVAGIGDAENDHAFLSACECGAAVHNALGSLMAKADFVTRSDHGEGVIELIDYILDNDLADLEPKLSYRNILLGRSVTASSEVSVPPYGLNVLVAGTSGGGKSTLTTGFIERLRDARYQFLVIDPEGDYQTFDGALVLGSAKGSPSPDEIVAVLEKPGENVVLSLLAVDFDQRPRYFETLLPRVNELRARTGRPHWIILDETHHFAPSDTRTSAFGSLDETGGLFVVSPEPSKLAIEVLRHIDIVIAVGREPETTIAEFCRRIGEQPPAIPPAELEKGEAIIWSRRDQSAPVRIRVERVRTERVRHSRKYAEAELAPDRSFFFRGPDNRLNLRAANLITFLNLMEGVDEETWLYHLRRGEYSRWFRENIKDDELASAAEAVEREARGDADSSRRRIRELVEERYSLPA